ncbi:MAG TPA: nicotinamide-nucleotide amidohydrolase family protein, partial [bacterium]|nr:nicotinamide-nucleotide amidohydrolase family protein [bacterium]
YCTTVPNCSPSMLGGAVVYSPQSKTVLAGVPTSLLEEFGTVAPETSLSLASGIRDRLRSDIGMGVTGYAGPTGGTAEHPVGRVYWALMAKGAHRLQAYDIPGDRSAVVRGAIKAGFDLLRGFLASEYGIAPERGGDNGGS